jgi:uncharacterized membrane protein YedE/YeeE
MSIDWPNFALWSALAGGVLIGLAAVLLLFGTGRVAGIAGIVGAACNGMLGDRQAQAGRAVRWAFIAGLALSPWLWSLVAAPPVGTPDVGLGLLLLAGLLVGFGVRMGNGCTSGHGICGLSRWSPRSLVNVLCFMGAGFATVALLRHF